MGVRIEVAQRNSQAPIKVYNIKGIEQSDAKIVAELLADPISETFSIDAPVVPVIEGHEFLEVHPKPGVTDPEGEAVQVMLNNLGYYKVAVLTGRSYLVESSQIPERTRELVGATQNFRHGQNLGFHSQQMGLASVKPFDYIDIKLTDKELLNLSAGRRLALNLIEMHRIKDLFGKPGYLEKRKEMGLLLQPTDAELEAIAQTWSEHCRHKKLNAIWLYESLDPNDESGLASVVRGVFEEIIKAPFRQSTRDWFVSVFEDNAGVIRLNPRKNISHKVETHNHPCAIEGFGGANTGSGGVFRDPASTGTFMRPVSSQYGFRVPHPDHYNDLPPGMQPTRRMFKGIVEGVGDYGNKMGIPTMSGTVLIDDGWLKPAVYVGCVAVAPAEINGRLTHIKNIRPGYVVLSLGGRVGKDGIHGATGSSQGLDSACSNLEVQIGNPIVEKCVFDAMEALQKLGMIEASQDCGAGGWNSAVGELAGLLNELEKKRYETQGVFRDKGITKNTPVEDRLAAANLNYPASMLHDQLKQDVISGEIFNFTKGAGGVKMDLTNAPEKYKGLAGWEKLISEAQEREVIVVKPENVQRVLEICRHFNVEATQLAEFNDTGDYLVTDQNTPIVYMPVDFMHASLPPMTITAKWSPPAIVEPEIPLQLNLTETLLSLIGQPNLQSYEWISTRYDHEVQGGSRIKPIVGVGRGRSDAIAYVPVLGEPQVVIETTGSNPWQGDIDAYHMGRNAVVDAIGRIVAAGGSLDKIAFNGNTTCPAPEKDPYIAAQVIRMLKGAADAEIAFDTPTISGKDSTSMERTYKSTVTGKDVTVKAKPELLMSALGVIDDDSTLTTPDFKLAGDLIYVVGETKDELGASEFYLMHNETGRNVPKSDFSACKQRYKKLSAALSSGTVHSAQYIGKGGLAAALVNCAIAGDLGVSLDIGGAGELERPDKILFSETTGRFIVTVHTSQKQAFEAAMAGNAYEIGTVSPGKDFEVKYGGSVVVKTDVDTLREKNKGEIRL